MNDYITGTPIYRFEPADCGRIESLRDGRLFIADPSKFNDPLDLRMEVKYLAHRAGFSDAHFKAAASELHCDLKLDSAHWLYNEQVLDDINRWIEGGMSDDPNHIGASLKRHIETFGVQCFSSSYKAPLSWSHYASGHRGFCVEYDLRRLDFASNNPELVLLDVTYSNKLPDVCVSEVLFSPHQVMPRLLATKTIDWAYEQELRIIHFTYKGGKIDMPKGLRVASLIGGASISRAHLKLLCSAGQELDVPVYKMVKNDSSSSDQLWCRDRVDSPTSGHICG